MLILNQNLQKLVSVAQKPVKLAVGLMSGTSLDGLDIALCEFTGNGLKTQFKLLQYITIPYEDGFKDEVRSIFSKRSVDLEKVCLLNNYIGQLRWRAPKAPAVVAGIQNATVQPNQCYQASQGRNPENPFKNVTTAHLLERRAVASSEDCLFLK